MSTRKQECSWAMNIPACAANTLSLMLALAVVIVVAQSASAQTFSLLYQFKAGRDGSNPYASLILDAKGNLYGTTSLDGAYAYGTVFKVSPDGKETVLYSFTGGADGATPFTPLTHDNAGNLYGTTEFGGLFGGGCPSAGCGVVFVVDRTGKETVLYRFTGAPEDGESPVQGVIRDSAGNLYGTTIAGGAYGGGTVFKIDPSGTETILHSFNPNGSDGYFPYGGSLLRGPNGNLYGTTELGGSQGVGTVFKLDPSGNETILHDFSFSATDGYVPYGTLVPDPAGNLYGVTNEGGAFAFGIVFKVDSSNNESVLYSFSGTDGDGEVPGGGLVRDSEGNLYGTTNSGGTSYCGTVFRLDSSGTETILHSFSNTDGRTPDFGLVRDSAGNLYGTTQYGGEFGGGVVFKVTP